MIIRSCARRLVSAVVRLQIHCKVQLSAFRIEIPPVQPPCQKMDPQIEPDVLQLQPINVGRKSVRVIFRRLWDSDDIYGEDGLRDLNVHVFAVTLEEIAQYKIFDRRRNHLGIASAGYHYRGRVYFWDLGNCKFLHGISAIIARVLKLKWLARRNLQGTIIQNVCDLGQQFQDDFYLHRFAETANEHQHRQLLSNDMSARKFWEFHQLRSRFQRAISGMACKPGTEVETDDEATALEGDEARPRASRSQSRPPLKLLPLARLDAGLSPNPFDGADAEDGGHHEMAAPRQPVETSGPGSQRVAVWIDQDCQM
jgi:hypothetical protein